jgi:hypothetical protein
MGTSCVGVVSALLCIAVLSGCHAKARNPATPIVSDEPGLHAHLGQVVVLTGTADYNYKDGAVVNTSDGQRVFLEQPVGWDESVVGKSVSIRGALHFRSAPKDSMNAAGAWSVFTLEPIGKPVLWDAKQDMSE